MTAEACVLEGCQATAAMSPSELARAALTLVGYLRSESAKQRGKAADDLVRYIEALELAARRPTPLSEALLHSAAG